MLNRFIITVIVLLMLATPALAHPGHGTTEGFSPLHYLIDPLHLPLAIVGGAAAIGVIALVTHRTRRYRR